MVNGSFRVTHNNLNSEKKKLCVSAGLSEILLKFQMGFKVADAIYWNQDSISTTDMNPVTAKMKAKKTAYGLRHEIFASWGAAENKPAYIKALSINL